MEEIHEPDLAPYWVFLKDGAVRAVLRGGILYRDRWFHLIEHGFRTHRDTWEPLIWDREQEVKYPKDSVPPVGQRNRTTFPVLLQRFVLDRERFELRAEKEPEPGRQDTLVILNGQYQIVGMVSDEWGATLLRVASEYQRRGIGRRLRKAWTEINPRAQSGGLTFAGEATAMSLWEARVREWLSRGWYSELLRQGRLTQERYKQIVASLSPAGHRDLTPLPEPSEPEPEPTLLVLTDNDSFFVLYDARFLNEQDEKYILGHGFFRDTDQHGVFPFRLDYEPPFAKLATAILLQMARNQQAPLYVATTPADLVEWWRVPGATEEGGYVELSGDVLDLPAMARLERIFRQRSGDPYQEKRDLLHEMADAKWGVVGAS